jgi:hypothetical protein
VRGDPLGREASPRREGVLVARSVSDARGRLGEPPLPGESPSAPKSSSRSCRSEAMRIIHKCPQGQGSGSASPQGRARALAPSQSYRFVSNPHGLPPEGRRPQNFPEKSSRPCEVGRAETPRGSGRNPGEAAGEIISRHEPARAEFIAKQRSPAASWLDLKQLTEPHQLTVASSPLQDREKP